MGPPRVLCLCVSIFVNVCVWAAAAGGGSHWQRVNNLRTNNFGKCPKQREQPEIFQKPLNAKYRLTCTGTSVAASHTPRLRNSLPFPLSYSSLLGGTINICCNVALLLLGMLRMLRHFIFYIRNERKWEKIRKNKMAAHFLFLCVLKSAPADARRCEEKCEKIKCSKTERAKDTARKGKIQRARKRENGSKRERKHAKLSVLDWGSGNKNKSMQKSWGGKAYDLWFKFRERGVKTKESCQSR